MMRSSVKHTLTASAMSTWLKCQQMYRYSYEDGYRSKGSDAIAVGRMFHELAEGYWIARSQGVVPSVFNSWLIVNLPIPKTTEEGFLVAQVDVMMRAYVKRWETMYEDWRVVSVEEEFYMPLKALSSPPGRRSHNRFRLGGKIDLILQDPEGRYYVVEHKTTARDVSPGSTYWERTNLDHQVSMYLMAVAVRYGRVDGFIYDVVRRPTLKPYTATPFEQRKWRNRTQDEELRGVMYGADELLYASQRLHDETPAEYWSRLRGWANEETVSHPNLLTFSEERIERFTETATAVADQIVAAGKTGRVARNANECFQNGRCPYYQACAFSTPLQDIAGLSYEPKQHPELEGGRGQ